MTAREIRIIRSAVKTKYPPPIITIVLIFVVTVKILIVKNRKRRREIPFVAPVVLIAKSLIERSSLDSFIVQNNPYK